MCVEGSKSNVGLLQNREAGHLPCAFFTRRPAPVVAVAAPVCSKGEAESHTERCPGQRRARGVRPLPGLQGCACALSLPHHQGCSQRREKRLSPPWKGLCNLKLLVLCTEPAGKKPNASQRRGRDPLLHACPPPQTKAVLVSCPRGDFFFSTVGGIKCFLAVKCLIFN